MIITRKLGSLILKKVLILLVAAVILLGIFYEVKNRTYLDQENTVDLIFCYDTKNVHVQLTPAESKKVVQILNHRSYYSLLLDGEPSCGFDKNVSFEINGVIYCMACDRRSTVKELPSGKYFDVSEEGRAQIVHIFEKYGGFFPCE